MVQLSVFARTTTSLCFTVVLFYALSILPVANAVSNNPWASGDPELTTSGSISLDDFAEEHNYRSGYKTNATCVNRNIKIQDTLVLIKKYKLACWYNTSIGMISEDGLYVLRPGTDIAGEIITASQSNMRSHLHPTPNPDVFIEITPISGGSARWQFHTAASLQFSESRTLLGAVQLRYDSRPELVLKTETGTDVLNGHVSGWWSSNAESFLVWHTRNGTLYRVNVTDFSVFAVHVRTSKNTLSASAALSPSGRYAAVAFANGSQNDVVVIDYESCNPKPGEYVTVGSECTITNFRDQLRAQVPKYKFAELPRFYNDHTLGFYHLPYNTTGDFTQYLLQANGTTRAVNSYVALGDSYSSGEGAGSYLPGTDNYKNPSRNMCHTSTNSYPYLINRQLALDSFLSVACSGARIVNYTSFAQYKDSSNILPPDYPGKNTQGLMIEKHIPNVVTITMSGNDIGFKDKLIKCILYPFTCYPTYESRMEIALEIQKEYPMLVGMYRDILKNMGPNPRLYVLGYPQVASADDGSSCGANVELTAVERTMAAGLIEYLNAVIRTAAAEAGAYYVDIEDSLYGHRLCEAPSATIAVNGLSFGNDGNKFFAGNASFHPNEFGHELIKNTLLQQTANFTQAMPAKLPQTIPNPNDFAFLDARKDGSLVRTPYLNTPAETPILTPGSSHKISVDNPLIPLLPDAPYDVFIRSKPVYVDTITTDGAGFIDANIAIPEGTEPGLHSLHIQGLGLNNQPIDVYEFVYVAANETDYDGDGIPNIQEPCGGFIEASGTDIDQDGTDDACDAYIAEAPTQENPEQPTTPTELPTESPAEPATSDRQPIKPQNTPALVYAATDEPIQATSLQPNTPATTTQTESQNTNEQNVLSETEANTKQKQKPEDPQSPNDSVNYKLFMIIFSVLFVIGYSVIKYAKQKA